MSQESNLSDSSSSLLDREGLLDELTQLARRLAVLETLLLSADAGAVNELARDVEEVLARTIAITASFDRLDTAEPEELCFAGEEEPATWIGMRSAVPSTPSLSDVCFASGFELSRAARELARPGDVDARLSAAETACRKLYRALHAIFEATRETSTAGALGAQLLRKRKATELERALVVRRLYAEFRHSLRRANDDSRESVLTALRYAAGGVALLTASPHYGAIRASDRALLRRLRDRLLEWSHAGKPASEGLQLLEDIWTSADLLRDINRRQELRAHDAELMRSLAGDSLLDHAGWLTSLERLKGLDETLDGLAARLRSAPNSNELLVEIMLRLAQLG